MAGSPTVVPSLSHADPAIRLAQAFRGVIASAFADKGLTADGVDPLISPCKDPSLGDFQSNAAMGLAKKLGMKPRDVAEKIVQAAANSADLATVLEPLNAASIAGPGFINLRLKASALEDGLVAMDAPHLGLPPDASPMTIAVDLMGVNLSKQMHVGHLRSPIIGDCLARTYERLGHKVIRQNHVGDWGLPIAMVTARLMKLADAGTIDLNKITLDQLDKAYKDAQAECQRDAAGLEAAKKFGLGPKAMAELEEQVAGATEAFMHARQTLVKLQQKEPNTYAVWQRIYEVTMKVCLDVCKTLRVNVTAEANAGESSYADEMPAMVVDLESRGVAVPDQGALIIRLDDPPTRTDDAGKAQPLFEALKEPCLVRKTDGGFMYATTDICAIRRRVQKFQSHRLVYAIDARQSLHMKQVFASSLKAGYGIHPVTKLPARMEHAAFGSVLGEDGKPFKTRSGESVKLADLIEETFERAEAAMRSRSEERQANAASSPNAAQSPAPSPAQSPGLQPGNAATSDAPMSNAESRAIAEAVGVAALKYGDLSSHRANDYVFSFNRMLAFEGNTGPYLLYAYVRTKSIFRKSAERFGPSDAWRTTVPRVAEPAEKQLALALLKYPGVIQSVGESLEPHRLCGYLYELAGAFSSFFDQCPVLAAPSDELRNARLRLCDLTGRVLADGLGVLGIPVIERM